MRKMDFTYSSGWKEFEQYCRALYDGYCNRYCKANDKLYEREMCFIQKKVKENKELLKQLWVSAFIGMVAKKYDLTITAKTQSCALILSLFNLLPFNAMEIGVDYLNTDISLIEYEVGKRFYDTAKAEIEEFFYESGYEILWLGPVDMYCDEIQPVGVAVLPRLKNKLDYIDGCGKLEDGTVGLIEGAISSYDEPTEYKLEVYYFRPTKRNTKLDTEIQEGLKVEKTKKFECTWKDMVDTGLMSPEETVRFQYLKPTNRDEMERIIAYCMADINHTEMADKNILISIYPFTREDMYMYLIDISMSQENAYYWTEIICKGQFTNVYKKGSSENEAMCFDDGEVEMFQAVKYLPSNVSVLTTYELYRRCAVQNNIYKKMVEVDF